jgi:hypothetical protein
VRDALHQRGPLRLSRGVAPPPGQCRNPSWVGWAWWCSLDRCRRGAGRHLHPSSSSPPLAVQAFLVVLAVLGLVWVDPAASTPPFASSSSASIATRNLGPGRCRPAPRRPPPPPAATPQQHDDDYPLLFAGCGRGHPFLPMALLGRDSAVPMASLLPFSGVPPLLRRPAPFFTAHAARPL